LIFIELPAESIAYRLEKSKVQRPLIKNLKGAELVGFINEKLNQRKIFYDKSHLVVSGINVTPQILQQKIIEFKNKNI
jgi:shikimate kinase